MKTLFLSLSLFCLSHIRAQKTETPSIAVATPHVEGLKISPIGAAKMIRLELIKLKMYNVYDEFDMQEIIKSKEEFTNNCYGQNCLINLGEALKTDYIMCGSVDLLGGMIVVTLKIIDVKNQQLYRSSVHEFNNNEMELQRMIEQVIFEIHDKAIDKSLQERLSFKNDVITSTNIGKLNNSGPRIGTAALVGHIKEFAQRKESQGGMNIVPFTSMIGYQLEGQYVGTDNFSALVEGIVNISGLEQGQFIPSFTFMNGFRFGKGNWEFAFGPGFGFKKMSSGFFDSGNLFSTNQRYFNRTDWDIYTYEIYGNDPEYFINGMFAPPTPEELSSNAEGYNFDTKYLDTRGSLYLNTSFVFAFGKTFHAGALNIPVNLFYSSQKGGGYVGCNVGFNVLKHKTQLNH